MGSTKIIQVVTDLQARRNKVVVKQVSGILSYWCKYGTICFHLVRSFTILQVVPMAIIQGVRYKLLRACGPQIVNKFSRVEMQLVSSLLALSALLQDVTELFQASTLKRGLFCFIMFSLNLP